MQVFKFGGASLKNADAFKKAVTILRVENVSPLILVVSAMGKTTNLLENIHKSWIYENDNLSELYNHAYNYHFEIIDSLFTKPHKVRNQVDEIFSQLNSIIRNRCKNDIEFDISYDVIIPFGELLSSIILSNYLEQEQILSSLLDARKVIFTDNTYREGRIDWDKTSKAIKNEVNKYLSIEPNQIIITQGFIGTSAENKTITLGREGSDFTAGIFAHCLNASKVTIWKDVAGLFNADPKNFENVSLIPHISYHEAVELAYYGQSIIHPKTIKPLQNKKIPLYIRSFNDMNAKGTTIDDNTDDDNYIPSFIIKKNQFLVSVSPKDFSFINENNLSLIFEILFNNGVTANVIQNSAISFSFCCDYNSDLISKLVKDLKKEFFVRYNKNLELITIRNYNNEIIDELMANKNIYLEQKSRMTAQIVVGENCVKG